MTRYLLLNIVFMIPVIVLAYVRRDRFRGLTRYIMAITAFLLGLTLVFDNIIILLDIVRYDSSHIFGLYAYRAPVEDFMYTLAAVLLIGALWKDPDHA